MKKTHTQLSDVRSESGDVTRRVYRSIQECIRNVDEQQRRSQSCVELFKPLLNIQRAKLRDLCERLVFADSKGHGQKGEEMLWRKGYYDAIAVAKRLKKGVAWTSEEAACLQSHLFAGIGHYHHLLFRLQSECHLNLQHIVDFSLLPEENELTRGKSTTGTGRLPDASTMEWARAAAHRCLVYLGDLTRYLMDINPPGDPSIPERYYQQALVLNPNYGMPHNQLGSLAGTCCHGLDAAYHYMRCLVSLHTFEGSEGNLQRALERSWRLLEETSIPADVEMKPTEVVRLCISRFLTLVYVWLFQPDVAPNIEQHCQTTIQLVGQGLNLSMTATEVVSAQEGSDEWPSALSDNHVFKMFSLLLLCIGRMKHAGSSQVTSAKTFTLAMTSQILQVVLKRLGQPDVPTPEVASPTEPEVTPRYEIQEDESAAKKDVTVKSSCETANNSQVDGIIPANELLLSSIEKKIISCESSEKKDLPLANGKTKESKVHKKRSRLAKLRRRRRVDIHSDDSEASDGAVGSTSEEEDDEVDDVDSEASISDLPDSSDEDIVADDKRSESRASHTSSQSQGSSTHLSALLELFSEGGLHLSTIKIATDWLRGDLEVVRYFGKSSHILLSRLISLLNVLAHAGIEKGDVATLHQMPLPEDVTLRGVFSLKSAQHDLNWNMLNTHTVDTSMEVSLRVHRLVSFGHFLASQPDSGVSFDNEHQTFVVAIADNTIPSRSNGPATASRKKLMQNMGAQWLRAEVRELEHRVRYRSANFSPYIVVDGADVLTKHLPLAKQLVSARRFILIIPTIVVVALDEMKRSSGRAREAIRWLETEFQRGNRFLRSQRNHERTALPLMKYPRRKDKEAWTFFQVLECCNHFSHQSSLQGPDTPIVTLLTGHSIGGSDDPNTTHSNDRGFSPVGLARSAGVNIEHIESFHAKWKKSSTGKDKR